MMTASRRIIDERGYMKKYILLLVGTSILILSCFDRQSSGTDLSRLGFYSSPGRIIEKLKSGDPGFREHFMLGLAYKDLKQYRSAIFHFANSAFVYERKKNLRTFAGPVHQFVDEFHIKSDYFDDAMFELAGIFYLYREFDHVVKFVDLMDKAPTALYRDAIALKSRALVEQKKHDKAAETLADSIPSFQHKGSQAILRIRLASAYRQMQENGKALEEFFSVIELDPDSWQSSVASGQITELIKGFNYTLRPAQKLALGISLYHSRKYTDASVLIADAISSPDLKDGREGALLYLIKTHVRERQFNRARALVQQQEKNPSYNVYAQAEADALWSSGNLAMAVEKYRQLASKKSESAKDALKRVVIYTEERKLPGFQALLREYINRFPDDANSDLFSWLLARSYIRARDFTTARNVIDEYLGRMPEGKHSDHMRFWLYKIHVLGGKHEDALSVLRDMSVKNPDSSYTWILLDLASREPLMADAAEKLDSCTTDECRALYHGILTVKEKDLVKRDQRIKKYGIGDTRPFRDLEKRISSLDLPSGSAGALRRLEKYFMIGNIDALNREISVLPDDDDTKTDIHTALAHFGGRYRNHYLSAFSTIQLLNSLKIENNMLLMHRDTIHRLYPAAFDKCVKKYSGKYKISRASLYAVIRAESLYNHEAVSSAGAVGLMQLMPPTARSIARELGDSTFDLKKPCTSVKFGAHHLAWLNKAYNGRIELMIAAYNAGPGNVQKWQAKFQTDDIHLFTELVPFDETRYYILRTKKHLLQGGLAYGD